MGYAGISFLRTIDQMASEICGVQNGFNSIKAHFGLHISLNKHIGEEISW